MAEIKIDGEIHYVISEASKKTGLTEQSLRQYIKFYRKEELSGYTAKIGATLLLSKSGVEYLKQLRKNKTKNEPIVLGGIKFNSKKDACEHFGFTPSELSHYIKIKMIEDTEQAQ